MIFNTYTLSFDNYGSGVIIEGTRNCIHQKNNGSLYVVEIIYQKFNTTYTDSKNADLSIYFFKLQFEYTMDMVDNIRFIIETENPRTNMITSKNYQFYIENSKGIIEGFINSNSILKDPNFPKNVRDKIVDMFLKIINHQKNNEKYCTTVINSDYNSGENIIISTRTLFKSDKDVKNSEYNQFLNKIFYVDDGARLLFCIEKITSNKFHEITF
jgi:hypothetical protein